MNLAPDKLAKYQSWFPSCPLHPRFLVHRYNSTFSTCTFGEHWIIHNGRDYRHHYNNLITGIHNPRVSAAGRVPVMTILSDFQEI